ncbi:AAA domain-containing protein [Nocardiopsis sp. NPDC006139]|uniref:caspase, EACC1-associated type n=1 Tax=Nocardiopsis sp. NPDC006139 TaxID=3154578 RepID=UPI0033B5776C
MKRTAILIGVNCYEELDDLRSPHADVLSLERVLRANGHYDRIQTLLDPVRNEAMEVLEAALAEAGPRDLLLISFSGHGLKDKRGRLHLALRDTRRKRLETTAISSEVLKRLLEDSRMRSRVLLLDCCYGGAFADGFATRGAEEEDPLDLERQLSDGAGIYVIAASGALERAREGDNSQGVRPSPFSSAVIRGLAGAAPDADGDGWIDAVDLYQHVHREVDEVDGQRVTVSSLGVRGSLILARHTGAATATGLPGRADGAAAPDTEARGAGAGRGMRDASSGRGTRTEQSAPAPGTWSWAPYLDYLRDGLLRQSLLQQLPDAGSQDIAVCDMGSEALLSRALERWAPTGRAGDLAGEAAKESRPLRYGYPAVLFDPARRGRRGGRPKAAPLVVMDVEMVEEPGGRFLVPVGEPELNRELLLSAEAVAEEDIEELLAWFEADRPGDGVAALSDRARTVCGRLGLAMVDRLAAGGLRRTLDLRPGAQRGAYNAALLYRGDPAATAVKQLVGDLDHREGGNGIRPGAIRGTALGALSEPAEAAREHGVHAPAVVTGHGNSAQEAILASAMNRTLTVATGAPGTGKSELITSVVTTAVAAGQSVLVASTNNTAVDEVAGRVNRIGDGTALMVRTGNRERRAAEPEALTALLAASWPEADAATAGARLAVHERALGQARQELAEAERRERRSALIAGTRRRLLGGLPPPVTAESFGDSPDLHGWRHRVGAAMEARWTGWWHRWRTRRLLGIDGTETELAAVLSFLEVEHEWRALRASSAAAPSPEETAARIRRIRAERREASEEYLLGRTAEALRRGRGVIEGRLRDLASKQKSWKGMRPLVRTVRAWAVTSRSVRGVFPPDPGLFDLVVVDEATQCTVADLVPLLYRARRALVIGDPHQLQPVDPLDSEDDRRLQAVHGLDRALLEERSLGLTGASAYHAAASALVEGGGEVLWLDEHYRCHPDIIAPVNRRFYGGRLSVRTDTASLAAPVEPAVRWIDVQGSCERPRAGSCLNRKEGEAVLELLRELWRTLPPDAGIGVVSPFAAQVRWFEENLGEQAAERIRVGTAHRFQGGERDVVVISPTAATGVHRNAGQWALSRQNLWNVAATRARSRLYIVGDRRYWEEKGGLLADLASAGGPAEETGLDAAGVLLFEALLARGRDPRVGHRAGGYSCDLVVPGPDGDTAVVLDGAAPDTTGSSIPGRALERTVDRVGLFAAVSGMRTVRVPAWRCLAEPEAVAAELV